MPELGSEVKMDLCPHCTNLSPLYNRFALETASEGCPEQRWRASQLFSTVVGWGSVLKLTSQLFFLFRSVDIPLESFHYLWKWTSTSRSQFKLSQSCLVFFWRCLCPSIGYSGSRGNLVTKSSCKSSHLRKKGTNWDSCGILKYFFPQIFEEPSRIYEDVKKSITFQAL